MASVKEIAKILEEEESLKLVTQVYSELSATKLQKIRADIERSRVFFNEISKVFSQVELLAQDKGVSLPESTLGTASLIITSNSRFYGEIENNLIHFFLDENAKLDSDHFLIGKTAQDFFTARGIRSRDYFFHFHQDVPTSDEIKDVVDKLRRYKKILVFYPKFESVLTQTPTLIDLTRAAERSQQKGVKPEIEFIFEPEIYKILEFFNSQIISVLLGQVFLESELARTAARLISMEEAQSKADEEIKKVKIQLGAAKKSDENAELLDTISSLTGWRRRRLENE